MCLAIPARILERLPDGNAVVDLGGVKKTVSLSLVEEAGVGDYVIVHVGYAIGKLDVEEAERTLALWHELSHRLAPEFPASGTSLPSRKAAQ